MTTAQTAKTLYVDDPNGVRYAYRKLGKTDGGLPLVMHCHYRSNMDYWDPLLLNSISATRPVIIFDQAGVGRSSGEVATTYAGWADHVIALVTAIGLDKFDLLGFSMGGGAVQMVALKVPHMIRKLILAGTFPSVPGPDSDVSGIVWPQIQPDPKFLEELSVEAEGGDPAHAVGYSFFYDTNEGRAVAAAYWSRVQERSVPDEPIMKELLNDEGSKGQMASAGDWLTYNPENSYDRLHELKMPVLVMNGDNDYLIPTSRSWELAVKIENAQLTIYPKSGHGFLYQYAELVGKHINLFLDDFGGSAKL
jgi:pimeloyl-ACP methyl ester carboxylesterase